MTEEEKKCLCPRCRKVDKMEKKNSEYLFLHNRSLAQTALIHQENNEYTQKLLRSKSWKKYIG